MIIFMKIFDKKFLFFIVPDGVDFDVTALLASSDLRLYR